MEIGARRTRTLQKETQHVLRARDFPWRVDEPHFIDGKLGPITDKTAGFMAWTKGAPPELVGHLHRGQFHDITLHQFKIVVGQVERPKLWIANDKDRRPIEERLREEHRKAVAKAKAQIDGVVTFDGLPCAGWIAHELTRAREHGWGGVLVSGYRTPQHSQDLCFAMCGAPSCPGRCAGLSSNHCCPPSFKCQRPEGAADVTLYDQLLEILRRIGSPLKGGMLPSDPVHFSATGF